MLIITRRAALEAGLKRYYTGRRCGRNHDCERSVSTGACIECLAHYARGFRTQKSASAMGLNSMTVQVHPNHQERVLAFVELCRLHVINGTPVPHVPHRDDVAMSNVFIGSLWNDRNAQPIADPVISRTDPYEMWVRIHGKERADEMLDVYGE